MALTRFHCPECSFGDYEVGHLTDGEEIYCSVCLERDDQLIRLRRWEEEGEGAQTRLRLAAAA
jgi:hypothetical protein